MISQVIDADAVLQTKEEHVKVAFQQHFRLVFNSMVPRDEDIAI